MASQPFYAWFCRGITFVANLCTFKCKIFATGVNFSRNNTFSRIISRKGWLAIAKLKSLSLFMSLLLMLKKAFDNVKIEQ